MIFVAYNNLQNDLNKKNESLFHNIVLSKGISQKNKKRIIALIENNYNKRMQFGWFGGVYPCLTVNPVHDLSNKEMQLVIWFNLERPLLNCRLGWVPYLIERHDLINLHP